MLPSRHHVRQFAQLFSVLTGLSFLLSILIQSVIFASWGLDFTAIASVEDAIMGGLRLLMVFLAAALAASGGALAIAVAAAEKEGKVPRNSLVVRVGFAIGMAVIPNGLVLLYPWDAYLREELFSVGFLRFYLIACGIVCVAAGAIFWLTSRISMRNVFAQIRSRPRSFAALWAGVSCFYMLPGTLLGYTNLSLVNEESLPVQCQYGSGFSHRIWWIGSKSLIVSCDDTRVMVIIHSDNPIAIRVGRPDRTLRPIGKVDNN